ncbi:cathepsin O-like isoform X2 [Clavelina lepadiformis]|uniref:cathepsin O-like isoform X2 n=1 Tax=Clavelina lepadiformis TaxID=159417 RepID=UPI0040429A24
MYRLMVYFIFYVYFTFSLPTAYLHENLFEEYVAQFKKPYRKGSEEYLYRYKNFLATLQRIKQRNFDEHKVLAFGDNKTKAVYRVNKFSDLSQQEFRGTYLSHISSEGTHATDESKLILQSDVTQLPDKFDWRTANVITAVKNQGKCGSCWAFSTVETIESAWAIATKRPIVLSPQQVIDCNSFGYGCAGGNPHETLSWLNKTMEKLVPESVYPYHHSMGKCLNENMAKVYVGVDDYMFHGCSKLCPSVERKMMIPALLKYGPLIVSVDATSWQDYMGGVIQHHCSHDQPNHAVQVVGYDMTGVANSVAVVKSVFGPGS